MERLFLIIVFLSISLSEAYSRTIYLTFDDGPLGGVENILSALEEEEVPGAFFMVGMHVERSESHKMVLQKVQESIYALLGNHSYSHAFGHYKKFYSDVENVKQDMKKDNEILGINIQAKIHGRLPGRNVFRLPNLCYDDPFISQETVVKEIFVYNEVFASGFYLYGWDHEWGHEMNGQPTQSVERLIQEIDEYFTFDKTLVKNELILLMHDQMFRNEYRGKENLQNLIHRLKEGGYTIANLREYNSN